MQCFNITSRVVQGVWLNHWTLIYTGRTIGGLFLSIDFRHVVYTRNINCITVAEVQFSERYTSQKCCCFMLAVWLQRSTFQDFGIHNMAEIVRHSGPYTAKASASPWIVGESGASWTTFYILTCTARSSCHIEKCTMPWKNMLFWLYFKICKIMFQTYFAAKRMLIKQLYARFKWPRCEGQLNQPMGSIAPILNNGMFSS